MIILFSFPFIIGFLTITIPLLFDFHSLGALFLYGLGQGIYGFPSELPRVGKDWTDPPR